MNIGSALQELLADGRAVTAAALAALVALEVLLRATGFARPDTVDPDLNEP